MNRPVLIAAKRTPIGNAGHGFARLTVTDLAAPVIRHIAGDISDLGPVDDVVLGNCMGPGGNPARIAALAAGLGESVPGVTVDRQCGSGLDAVALAAARVRSGEDSLILAGGVESASTAPWRFWPPTVDGEPVRYQRAPFAPSGFPDPDMGLAADDLARLRGIDRSRQDEYAARSHALAAAFDFSAEVLPVGAVSVDQRIRKGMTTERLARLRPAFGAEGTATPGNSCGISDGAALVAVVGESARGGRPGLRVLASAVTGSDPALPGLGPVPAIHLALDRAGVCVADLGAVEITEAFASVVLAVVDEVGLDIETVCTQGGAIAMGHPWGASGAILLVRLMTRMLADDGPELGLAACAIGGGLGVAMIVERVSA